MRILHLITRSESGGGQAVAAALAHGSRSRGHVVAIASGPEGGGEAWAGLDASIERLILPDLVRSISLVRDLRALRQVARLCAEWKPDILHLHTSKAAALGRLAPGLDRSGMLYTMHGYDQLRVSNRRLLRVDQALKGRCGAIVAVSRRDQEAMIRDGYAPLYIPNGVVSVHHAPPAFGGVPERMTKARRRGSLVALSIARDAPPKRVDILRGAARILEGLVEIFWIGGDPRPGDPENFVALGALPGAGSYLRYADAFMLASDHEGLPISLLEAFSAGLPVVASGVGGIPELLGEGEALTAETKEGFARLRRGLAAENEASAFARALSLLATDESYRKEAGRAAFLAWERDYSAALMVQRYNALYATLLEGGRGDRGDKR